MHYVDRCWSAVTAHTQAEATARSLTALFHFSQGSAKDRRQRQTDVSRTVYTAADSCEQCDTLCSGSEWEGSAEDRRQRKTAALGW